MRKQEKSSINKSQELTNILNDAMINLKKMVDVNTVVGEPIITEEGTTIIPVSKVYVGIVSGGGELKTNARSTAFDYPFAGGSGSGFTVIPIGFLVSNKSGTNFVNTENDKSGEKLIEMTNRTLKVILENLRKEEK